MNFFVSAFPLWALAASLLALPFPGLFTWFHGGFITIGLGIIMLGMGLTLDPVDFTTTLKRPKRVVLGVFLQYIIMPFVGYGLTLLLPLPAEVAAGLILVASCPGGTASNVVTYLARADVPLSVAMTAVSTMLAVFMTPLLTKMLIGVRVEVNAWALFLSTIQVVLAPVILGLLLRKLAAQKFPFIVRAAPAVAVFFIVLIVASIIGQNNRMILQAAGMIMLAVFLLHTTGFALGYLISRVSGADIPIARTISIEVGMQNSGLGVVLAGTFASPLVAVPSAISSLFHSLIGSLLAGYWRRHHRDAYEELMAAEEGNDGDGQ